MAAAAPVTRAEFDAVYAACRTWGRWGADDRRGALNYLTPEIVRAAAGLIRSGRSVSCSWPLDTEAGPDNPKPVVHHMTLLPDQHLGDAGDMRFSGDFVGVEFHGESVSHIDALCHVLFAGRAYNGVAAPVSSAGAGDLTIDTAKDGIVGRGVLIDIPRHRGIRWVEPGEAVGRDEIQAALEGQGVELRQGDVVFFRTGHARRRLEAGPWDAANLKAGIHVTAMPLFHDAKVSAMAFDGDGDTIPSPCAEVAYPIHAIGISAMGLHFMDNLSLEDLASACDEEGRFEFFCAIAPLRLAAGTGSPVNPIAIL
jgi:kynurenine formamidase